jgi:hypothetical protein
MWVGGEDGKEGRVGGRGRGGEEQEDGACKMYMS